MDLILASASPRRSELLKNAGYDFTISVSDVDESVYKNLSPENMVRELAIAKARAVAVNHPKSVVIGSDTIVVLNDKVLVKPESEADAKQMLLSLSGKKHTVCTGVCAFSGTEHKAFVSKTEVEFFSLSQEEIDHYVSTGEPMDKAGAYGIQGYGSTLVRSITGDYFTVMGLPIALTARLLSQFGVQGKVISAEHFSES